MLSKRWAPWLSVAVWLSLIRYLGDTMKWDWENEYHMLHVMSGNIVHSHISAFKLSPSRLMVIYMHCNALTHRAQLMHCTRLLLSYCLCALVDSSHFSSRSLLSFEWHMHDWSTWNRAQLPIWRPRALFLFVFWQVWSDQKVYTLHWNKNMYPTLWCWLVPFRCCTIASLDYKSWLTSKGEMLFIW